MTAREKALRTLLLMAQHAVKTGQWLDLEMDKRINSVLCDLPPPLEAKEEEDMTAREKLYSFCAECGPNVKVDQDGCCGCCGGSCMGSWLYDNNVALVTLKPGPRPSKRTKRKA